MSEINVLFEAGLICFLPRVEVGWLSKLNLHLVAATDNQIAQVWPPPPPPPH